MISISARGSFAVLFTLGLAASASAACSKDSSSNGATGAAPSAAASGPATTSTLVPIKYDDKLPARGAAAVDQRAVKGGSGSTVISPASRVAAEEDTNRELRKPANVDKVDCMMLPDNAAECDGDKFYFCDDKQLWVTDCNAEAKFSGATGGSCFEGDRFIDCLATGTATDGTTESCDFSKTVCCDKDGACFTPIKG